MKQIYLILYIATFILYFCSLLYYTLHIVEKRLISDSAHLEQIKENIGGGRLAYNNYILADKDYYLTRSKGVLGSILSKKELSQFDINSISKRPSQKHSLQQISYFIDKENNNSPYTPIGLKIGDISEKDSWYYYTLFGYTIKRAFLLAIFAINILLAAKTFSLYNDSPFIMTLCGLSILIAIIFVILF